MIPSTLLDPTLHFNERGTDYEMEHSTVVDYTMVEQDTTHSEDKDKCMEIITHYPNTFDTEDKSDVAFAEGDDTEMHSDSRAGPAEITDMEPCRYPWRDRKSASFYIP